jgi:hypothetical protein
VSSAEREREYQTRKQRIDPHLEAAGWSVVPFVLAAPIEAYDISAVEEYETVNWPADYTLGNHLSLPKHRREGGSSLFARSAPAFVCASSGSFYYSETFPLFHRISMT